MGSDAPPLDLRAGDAAMVGGYDIGAVEWILNESSLAPRLYLPLLRR